MPHSEIRPSLTIKRIAEDFPVSDLRNKAWEYADTVQIKTYWSGEGAPKDRQFFTKLVWSETSLCVRFEAKRSEPLVTSERPDLTRKTIGLWDRDVCEIFIALDEGEPRKYFEFEIAPTGEWIDLAIDLTLGERKTDWEFASGMESAAEIENEKVVMSIKMPWKAFGKIPRAGDVWLGNLFRCTGKDPDRGYLAWSPTMTENPNFHVPDKFGEFRFIE